MILGVDIDHLELTEPALDKRESRAQPEATFHAMVFPSDLTGQA